MSLLSKISLGMVISGTLLIMPQIGPLIYQEIQSGDAKLLNFSALTYTGMMLIFFGIAILKFKSKEKKKPFRLTKNMSDVSVNEDRDHQYRMNDD